MPTYNDVLAAINSNLADGSSITANLHRAVEEALLNFTESQWLPGDIKEIDCDNAYITANFDASGLGIIGGEREGWAICNGNNGTKDRNGRVSVAYGTSYPTMGTVGGSKDAVVVEHSHTMTYGNTGTNTGTQVKRDSDGDTLLGTTSTNSTGVSGIDKNMQPYIVTLFIQKL